MIAKWMFREVLPPALVRFVRARRRDSIVCKGLFKSFPEARAASAGYDEPAILAKTLEATLAVKRGEAAYEQDTQLFYEPSPPVLLLYALALAASLRPDSDTVVDFGGALGSAYFRSRPYRAAGRPKFWSVVEQPGHVAVGQAEVADGCLSFASTLEVAVAGRCISLVHAGGVLQYVEDPRMWLLRLLAIVAPVVMLDRVPLSAGDTDVITVEYVPPSLYQASYPTWFFSETRLRQEISEQGWRILVEERCPDQLQPPRGQGHFSAFVLVRRDNPAFETLP